VKIKLSQLILALIKTTLLLVLFEIFSTTVIPLLGIHHFKFSPHVLFIIYLCIYMNNVSLPFLILFIEGVHSIFSIDGWAFGTLAGIILGFLMAQLKDLLEIQSTLVTILATFLSYIMWSSLNATFIFLKIGIVSPNWEQLLYFVGEGFILALFAPKLFSFLSHHWQYPDGEPGPRPI
jgi:hypothetical protein